IVVRHNVRLDPADRVGDSLVHKLYVMKSSRQSDYLTAPEALELLGVRRQTLYAYVSKGWIRSVPQEGSKSRLYPREDLEMLKRRSRARSGHGPVAASAMNW